MNPIIAPVIKIVEVVATWLDPARKERVILRNAINAAKNIIALLERTGEFKDISEQRRKLLRVHFQKQLDAWQDGTP